MNQFELVQIFRRIELDFNMQHACNCREWCSCWDKFKDRIIKELINEH